VVVERYHYIRGSVSNLAYHFVWCSKYRRPVLTDAVAKRLKDLLLEKALELHCTVKALEIMPDYVHLFVECPPTLAPQQIAYQFKGYSSRILRSEFRHLRSRIPSLWSRIYYVGSAGNVSKRTIQSYIEQQKTR